MGRNRFVVVMLALVLGFASVPAAQNGKAKGGLKKNALLAELRVGDETGPPGGIVQIKVFLTEPKPISTGSLELLADFDELEGVALFSPADDTYGLAERTMRGVRVVATSAFSAFGTSDPDYPVLTFAVRVPAGALPGDVLPLRLDPAALRLLDPNGELYEAKLVDGSLFVGDAPAVEDVVPGSDVVPAGWPVTVLGRGFDARVRLQVEDAEVDQVRVIGPTELEVLFGQATSLHATRFRVRSNAGRSEYFSYQRTQPDPSPTSPVNDLELLSPGAGTSAAVIEYPANPDLQVLAVQNSHLAPVTAALTLVSAGGSVTVDLALGGATHSVRELSEWFPGGDCSGGCTVVVYSASDTLHVMGASADATLTAVALLPPK